MTASWSPSWVSVVALGGWLILAASALRARQVKAGTAVRYALIWGAIFFAAAAVFTAVT